MSENQASYGDQQAQHHAHFEPGGDYLSREYQPREAIVDDEVQHLDEGKGKDDGAYRRKAGVPPVAGEETIDDQKPRQVAATFRQRRQQVCHRRC
ncbi:hypothetical protein ACFSHP_09710 [Novosphingobium panipatense]